MIPCHHCFRRTHTPLCGQCQQQLRHNLESVVWLLEELETTIARQDRLTTGTVGKAAATPSPVNFDAAQTARDAHATLQAAVRLIETTVGGFRPPASVPASFTGPLRPGWRRLPADYQPTAAEYIHWLLTHLRHIANHPKALDIFKDIEQLVGKPTDTEGGTLHKAINRRDQLCYGPCFTTTGRDRHGKPRECGTILYAPPNAETITCPQCGVAVDARKQRDDAKIRGDLRTVPMLLEVLADVGEKVSRDQLYKWIGAGQLKPEGYLTSDRGIVAHRTRRGDPAVYSLSRTRELRTLHRRKKKVTQ